MTSTRKLRPRGRPPTVAQSDSDSARTLRRKNANASGGSSEEEEEEEATGTKRRAMPMRAAKSSPIKKRRTTVRTSSSSSSEDDDDDDDDERPSEADKIRSARSAGKSPPSSPRRVCSKIRNVRTNINRRCRNRHANKPGSTWDGSSRP